MLAKVERCSWCSKWFTVTKRTPTQAFAYHTKWWCSARCHKATMRRDQEDAARRTSGPNYYDGFPLD
jgi:hypothetical protein